MKRKIHVSYDVKNEEDTSRTNVKSQDPRSGDLYPSATHAVCTKLFLPAIYRSSDRL